MFNTIDATDLSPYSRLVYVANEYFVNMKGEFKDWRFFGCG